MRKAVCIAPCRHFTCTASATAGTAWNWPFDGGGNLGAGVRAESGDFGRQRQARIGTDIGHTRMARFSARRARTLE